MAISTIGYEQVIPNFTPAARERKMDTCEFAPDLARIPEQIT